MPGLFLVHVPMVPVTPASFPKVIRVSAMDVVQSWVLRSQARREAPSVAAATRFARWREAQARHPGDARLFRECLEQALPAPSLRGQERFLAGVSSWLFRLSGTNANDVALAVQLFDRHRWDDLTVAAVSSWGWAKVREPAVAEAYLAALFRRGEWSRFVESRRHWHGRGGTALRSPELRLYEAAYTAGWGSAAEQIRGRARLVRAQSDPAQEIPAHQLALMVAAHRGDAEACERSLRELERRGVDRLEDHVRSWTLLAWEGRRESARQRLQGNERVPRTHAEALAWATGCMEQDLPQTSVKILRDFPPAWHDPESEWTRRGSLLVQQREWANLVELALGLRHEAHPLRERLAGLSYCWEGIGLARTGDHGGAQRAFEQLRHHPVADPVMELVAVDAMERFGFSELARTMADAIARRHGTSAEGWVQLDQMAAETGNGEYWVAAMATAYRLHPEHPDVMRRYAHALLATRQQPERSLALTRRLLEQTPADPIARLDHVRASLQNGQTDAALIQWTGLAPEHLAAQDQSAYWLVGSECRLLRGEFEEARRCADRVEARHLFVAERRWVEGVRAQLNELDPSRVRGKAPEADEETAAASVPPRRPRPLSVVAGQEIVFRQG